MRFILLSIVLVLFMQISVAQSLKSNKNFTVAVPKDAADAPMLITITDSLYDNLGLQEAGLDREIFYQAYKGYLYLISKNKLHNTDVLTIVDYSQSCNNKRLYVIDVTNLQLLYNTYVAHGKNSGFEFANSFSNEKDSNKSSIGFLVTGEVYFGNYGTALRLDGVENGINNNVRNRDIVFHGSNLVNEKRIAQNGRIVRSLGCPAVSNKDHVAIINAIKNASCFFIYHSTKSYAKHSKIINAKFYGIAPTNINTSVEEASASSL